MFVFILLVKSSRVPDCGIGNRHTYHDAHISVEIHITENLSFSLHHLSSPIPPVLLLGIETMFRKHCTFLVVFFSPGILLSIVFFPVLFMLHVICITNAIKDHSRTLSSKWKWLSLFIRNLLFNVISYVFPVPFFLA